MSISRLFTAATKLSLKLYFAFIPFIVGLTASILYAMGRVLYCTCGRITLWQGNNWSSENSQQLSDWYTFSHVIHGFFFYWVFSRITPKLPIGLRMVFAILIESGWEILENSPMIINRYRAQTISLDYYGDSVINSVTDIIACFIGFWLARKLPIWASILVIMCLEIGVAYAIHDNLTLNLIMLVHPVQAIKDWQLQLSPLH